MPNLLRQKLAESTDGQISFDQLEVTFAWDKVCIFEPYTNNSQAQKVLVLDWNIELNSKISYSDSIHALVFLYQGKPNSVVDLSRDLADFKNPNRCFDRSQTVFKYVKDHNGKIVIFLPSQDQR